jgi:hypothetical protein
VSEHEVSKTLVRLVAALCVMVAVAATGSAARAAELLMFETRGCPYCRAWLNDVGVAYPKTPEGQRAPLRRHDVSEARRLGIAFASPVTVSPTFVLVDDGREIGRITGYPGADFFWGLFGELLARLDRKASG